VSRLDVLPPPSSTNARGCHADRRPDPTPNNSAFWQLGQSGLFKAVFEALAAMSETAHPARGCASAGRGGSPQLRRHGRDRPQRHYGGGPDGAAKFEESLLHRSSLMLPQSFIGKSRLERYVAKAAAFRRAPPGRQSPRKRSPCSTPSHMLNHAHALTRRHSSASRHERPKSAVSA
jgi:hypothetical protein